MSEWLKVDGLIKTLLQLGANKAAVVNVSDITFDRRFREQCVSNACGCYGKNYMCPPDVGDIDALIARAQSYDKALVYQYVGELEDSFDIEGMMEAGKVMHRLTQQLRQVTKGSAFQDALHLGGGACRLCRICAKLEGVPCRHPDEAVSSLEVHGIAVSELAKLANMNYINGQNTVTYFGAMLYKSNGVMSIDE